MNRPNRFDDKIQVGFPDSKLRVELLEFFLKESLSIDLKGLIESEKCSKFSPAHLREVVIRSKIYNRTLVDSLNSVLKDIELYHKNFQQKEKFGFNNDI